MRCQESTAWSMTLPRSRPRRLNGNRVADAHLISSTNRAGVLRLPAHRRDFGRSRRAAAEPELVLQRRQFSPWPILLCLHLRLSYGSFYHRAPYRKGWSALVFNVWCCGTFVGVFYHPL